MSEVVPTSPSGTAEQLTPLDRLRSMWFETLADPSPQIDGAIDRLITCQVVSIRYALLTQLLGKLVDPSRDALSLQRGDPGTAEAAGRWDARSFCQTAVVPWVRDASQVLGTSPDPYVNNPLRRPRLDVGYEPRRARVLWDELTATLSSAQEREDPKYTETLLRFCLTSLARQYQEMGVQFEVPQRISLDATSSLVARYLEESSGGERPQVVVAALMRTVGQRFSIFDQVERQGINEADSANASPGDVICYKNGEQVLTVEVKDRAIALGDVDVAIQKARRSAVTEFLFATVLSQAGDDAIAQRTEREFNLGTNVYRFHIDEFLRVLLALAGEASRVGFLTLVGEELNDRVTQLAHKLAWRELLRDI